MENPGPSSTTEPLAESCELACPLCGYNLRGLATPRCPECGFAFSWEELHEAERNRHPYLFEHGRGHNFKTFWKTFWWSGWPRWFWRDLNPAQPVHLVRLLIFWLIAGLPLAAIYLAPLVNEAVEQTQYSMRARQHILATNGARTVQPGSSVDPNFFDIHYPLPWNLEFWRQLLPIGPQRFWGGYMSYASFFPLCWIAIFLLWPWLTLFALMIFRFSMRQAKIRSVHLIRTVIYSSNFGLLISLIFIGVYMANPPCNDGWLLVACGFACGVITNYRLSIAFSRYLRVHRPVATVVASQIITLLLVFLALVQIADFGRRT